VVFRAAVAVGDTVRLHGPASIGPLELTLRAGCNLADIFPRMRDLGVDGVAKRYSTGSQLGSLDKKLNTNGCVK
jgi:hypothetical protein